MRWRGTILRQRRPARFVSCRWSVPQRASWSKDNFDMLPSKFTRTVAVRTIEWAVAAPLVAAVCAAMSTVVGCAGEVFDRYDRLCAETGTTSTGGAGGAPTTGGGGVGG